MLTQFQIIMLLRSKEELRRGNINRHLIKCCLREQNVSQTNFLGLGTAYLCIFHQKVVLKLTVGTYTFRHTILQRCGIY